MVKSELDAMITQLLTYKDNICRRMEVMVSSRHTPDSFNKPQSGGASSRPPKITSVRRYDLCSVKRLQTPEDIDKYVERVYGIN